MEQQTIIILAYAFPIVLLAFIGLELEGIREELTKLNNK